MVTIFEDFQNLNTLQYSNLFYTYNYNKCTTQCFKNYWQLDDLFSFACYCHCRRSDSETDSKITFKNILSKLHRKLWLPAVAYFPAISFAEVIDKEVLIFLLKNSLTGATVENSYFIYKLKTANICKCYNYPHYI